MNVKSQQEHWPDDADADVLRALQARGFDFAATYEIDFNVDFENWPPSREAVEWLQAKYGKVELNEPSDDLDGYVSFRITSRLTHQLVKATQDAVTSRLRASGGVCETWGLYH